MLLDTKMARSQLIVPSRSLLAAAALMLLSGCFPGAVEQEQGVIVADIAAETQEE